MSMALPIIWTLEEALEIIRALQPETRKYQYHLCLGGGVLNKGRSEKDLDLYFLPMGSGKKPDPLGLDQWLRKLWGEGEEIGGLQPDGRLYPDEPPYLKRQKFMYGKLRIDVFILGQEKDLEGFEGEPRGVIDPNPQPVWRDLENGVRQNENFRGHYWDIQRDPQGFVPAVQPAEAAQEGARAGQVRIENANVGLNQWYVVRNGVGGNFWFDQPAAAARIDNIAVAGPQPVPLDEDR